MNRAIRPTNVLQNAASRVLVVLLCLSLVAWSVLPAAAHGSAAFEGVSDHLATAAEHGHAHDAGDDLYERLHGHAHDVDNHDHSQVLPTLADRSSVMTIDRDVWQPLVIAGDYVRRSRIERPPRV